MIQDLERQVRSNTHAESNDDYEASLKELIGLSNQRRAVIQKKSTEQTQTAPQYDEDINTTDNPNDFKQEN